jgi:hypothetical protein
MIMNVYRAAKRIYIDYVFGVISQTLEELAAVIINPEIYFKEIF